jgi:hypothetical protein
LKNYPFLGTEPAGVVSGGAVNFPSGGFISLPGATGLVAGSDEQPIVKLTRHNANTLVKSRKLFIKTP